MIDQKDAFIESIATRIGIPAERGRRFADLTSLRVGGAIDWVLSPKNEEQAAALVHDLEQQAIAWRLLRRRIRMRAAPWPNKFCLPG